MMTNDWLYEVVLRYKNGEIPDIDQIKTRDGRAVRQLQEQDLKTQCEPYVSMYSIANLLQIRQNDPSRVPKYRKITAIVLDLVKKQLAVEVAIRFLKNRQLKNVNYGKITLPPNGPKLEEMEPDVIKARLINYADIDYIKRKISDIDLENEDGCETDNTRKIAYWIIKACIKPSK